MGNEFLAGWKIATMSGGTALAWSTGLLWNVFSQTNGVIPEGKAPIALIVAACVGIGVIVKFAMDISYKKKIAEIEARHAKELRRVEEKRKEQALKNRLKQMIDAMRAAGVKMPDVDPDSDIDL